MYTNMKLPEEPSGWLKLWRLIFKEKEDCEHEWGPCIAFLHAYKEDKPARICKKCKKWEPLTDEQFFSMFGETFYTAVQRNRTSMTPAVSKTTRKTKT